MSWQTYVDTNLVGTGMVTSAGIYDLQGNPWAYSAGFAAQVAEVAAVSGHFAAPSGLAATGATVAGVKYMFVRGEENAEIYVKKGAEGVVFYRCNTCIIVGYHNDKIQPGQCSTTVAKLGDFLKESGI
uniref:Profilin n=1 Tax=Emiliania huxleyi TaxID=2903 RepID=A0A6U9CQC2_EMIHU|mmetsp:Transcript_31358/g.93160  ORF Transcript_31358/g.93160 Transcript_31358/m.93160 type:complete len:128 (+) Transcript_31358:64-447(+)